MSKALQLALGLLTSIGGFLEIGSVMTAAQAGAAFHDRLLWAVAAGALGLIVLTEMSGRLSAVSRLTIVDAIRTRFGLRFYAIVLVAVVTVSWLVLVAELGGMTLALRALTGIAAPAWIIPAALLTWTLLWKGRLAWLDNGAAALGLITIAFVVGALRLHPSWAGIAHGLLPTVPSRALAKYGFLGVSILGASISPYLMYFYSSGAVEGKWDASYLAVNRVIAVVGMVFGGMMAMAVLVLSAATLPAHHITPDTFGNATMMMTAVFPRWGTLLFGLAMLFTCGGAALEIALTIAYMSAQGLGWNWSENDPARGDARFSITYTMAIATAAIPLLLGINPIGVTMLSMALTALTLPLSIAPFLVLMNDRVFCGDHRNGWLSNTVVVIVVAGASLVALITIPLQILGG
jgi:Mn2+/Fe2+ NRAMP family transporter